MEKQKLLLLLDPREKASMGKFKTQYSIVFQDYKRFYVGLYSQCPELIMKLSIKYNWIGGSSTVWI